MSKLQFFLVLCFESESANEAKTIQLCQGSGRNASFASQGEESTTILYSVKSQETR